VAGAFFFLDADVDLMRITNRDQRVLSSLARYGLLNRRQIQDLCFPDDRDGRVARRRLAELTKAEYIRRHATLVASRYDGAPAPVYLIARPGCEYLADVMADPGYLLKSTKPPHPLHVQHHLAVADFHILLDAAIAAQATASANVGAGAPGEGKSCPDHRGARAGDGTRPMVELKLWHNEGDVIATDESGRPQQIRLFTVFESKPRKVCAPDAAFLLRANGREAAFYLELERGNGDRGTGATQLAARKCPGYAALAEAGLHRRHFPGWAPDRFVVLLVGPTPKRRDALRRAFGKRDAADHTDLWRFVARSDLNVENLLSGSVFCTCGEEPPGPLVRR
jgi:hypothetical protein